MQCNRTDTDIHLSIPLMKKIHNNEAYLDTSPYGKLSFSENSMQVDVFK
jgi:hypothetical protein